MKRKILSLLIVSLMVIMSIPMLILPVFADSSAQSTDPLETPYGTIPAEYADVDAHPFIMFNKQGQVIDTDTEFMTAEGLTGIFKTIMDSSTWDPANVKHCDVVIYVRKDIEQNVTFPNLSRVFGKVLIDLGGHTITGVSGKYIFNAEAKTHASLDMTVKNGTILTSDYLFMNRGTTKSGRYPFDATAMETYGVAKFNFTFENVTIGYADGAAAKPLMYTHTKSAIAINNTYNFVDCTFDLTNITPSSSYSLFDLNNVKEDVINVNIKGGVIKANSSIKVADLSKAHADSTFKFEATDSGEFTTVQLPTGSTAPAGTYTFGDKESVFKPLSIVKDGVTTYGYSELEGTPYGLIPAEYADANAYPFVMFDREGKFLAASDKFLDMEGIIKELMYITDYNPANFLPSTNDVVIYMRKDFAHTATFANLSRMNGKVLLDLGGHTITTAPGAYLFSAEAKSHVLLNITVKNGNIVAGDYLFINRGTTKAGRYPFNDAALETYGLAKFNFDFENVVFSYAEGAAAKPLIFTHGSSKYAVNNTYDFVNCTFDLTNIEITDAYSLFDLKSVSGEIINVTLNGGVIKAKSFDGKIADLSKAHAETTFKFEALNEKYTTIELPTTANAPAGTYFTAEGTEVLFKADAVDGEITTYVLAPATHTHTPLEDDGDCTTPVLCACGEVVVEAKAAHTPEDDDGNCLTAVKCKECTKITTEAGHLDPEPDFVCNRCGAKLVNPLETPYGMIPEQYADVDAYPFIIFDRKTGTVRHAAQYLISSTGGDKIQDSFYQLFNVNDLDIVIYVRKDFTQTCRFDNLGYLRGNFLIDLNGHTMTQTGDSFFGTLGKKNNIPVHVTVKNGTVLNTNFFFGDGGFDNICKPITYTFENVIIGFTAKAKPCLVWTNTSLSNFANPTNTTVEFIGCTFDLTTRPTGTLTIFDFTSPHGERMNITVKGGVIKANSFEGLSIVTIADNAKDTHSLTFEALYGKYMTVELPTTATAPTGTYNKNGANAEFKAGSVRGDITIYNLAVVDSLDTPYGKIPEKWADVDLYPFILFDKNGNAVNATNKLFAGVVGNEADTITAPLLQKAGSDHIVWVRKDFVQANRLDNISMLYGNIVIDLNGHTMTQTGESAFTAMSKAATALHITVKNGTILNTQYLVAAWGQKDTIKPFTFTFENLVIGYADGAVASPLIFTRAESKKPTDINVEFINCTFDFTNRPAGTYTLFDLTSPNGEVVNITMKGGVIKANSLDGVTIANVAANNSLKFVMNGKEYTKIELTATATAPTGSYVTDAGTVEFVTDFAYGNTVVYKLNVTHVHTPTEDDGDCTTPVYCACGEIAIEAKPSHTGGTATCIKKAECEVCGKEYGEFAAHIPSADDGDCKTAITCSVCEAVVIEAAADHELGEDDGDCTTEITCKNCDTVLVEAAEVHILDEDDGDCTTAIYCKNCDVMMVRPKLIHTPEADDGDCTTAVTCELCDAVVIAAKSAHKPGADDGDCTTEVKCMYCDKVATAAKSAHTPEADDGDCTTEVTCKDCREVTTAAKAAHADTDSDGKCDSCDTTLSTGNENTGEGDNTGDNTGDDEDKGGCGGSNSAAFIWASTLALAIYFFRRKIFR